MIRTKFDATVLALWLAISGLGAGCGTAQSPHRQIEDTTITAELKKEMAAKIGLSSVTNIDINTTNGVVTLAGQVESEEVKQRAEQIAHAVPGVVEVDNLLQVEAQGRIRQDQAGGPTRRAW